MKAPPSRSGRSSTITRCCAGAWSGASAPFYRAAATQARGSDLVRALTAEHHALAYLAGRLAPGTDGHTAATVAEWIATLFAGHVAKENDLLLPALTSCGADLAALLADMHEPQAG